MLVEVLGEQRVLTATNGRSALDLLREKEGVHLILCDVQMPVMTGADLAIEWLRDPVLCTIPLVLCSAEPDLSRLARTLRTTGFIEKPLAFERVERVAAEF